MTSTPDQFVWTKYGRRVANLSLDLARGKMGFFLLIAAAGLGKTVLLERIVRNLAWEHPLEFYLKLIEDTKEGNRGRENPFTLEDALAFAEKIGVIDSAVRPDAAALLKRRFDLIEERGYWHCQAVSGPILRVWLDWLAQRLNRPAPDALQCLPLYGVDEAVKGRYPLLVTGSDGDNIRSLQIKILRALRPDHRLARTYYRDFWLHDYLKELPCAIFLDEADRLDVSVLQYFRQLCGSTGTPFCLAGTNTLRARLERDVQLRPLLSRVEAHVTLRVTAKDLQIRFPDLDSRIVLAVWSASGQNFRTAVFIVRSLERLQEENPKRRLTKRAVEVAAATILAARPVDLGPDDEEEIIGEGSEAARALVGRPPQEEQHPAIASRRAARAAG